MFFDDLSGVAILVPLYLIVLPTFIFPELVENSLHKIGLYA